MKKKRYILGFADSHDAGAAIISSGRILAAVSEERLCREKNAYGFPFRAITHVLKQVGIQPQDIDEVIKGGVPYHSVFSYYNAKRNSDWKWLPRLRFDEMYNLSPIHRVLLNQLKANATFSEKSLARCSQPHRSNGMRNALVCASLRRVGIEKRPWYIDHHYAHLASGYYTSGFDKALVFSLDFSGDDKAGMVGLGHKNKVKVLQALNAQNSVGCFYGFITKGLGFALNRHEGKIVGLAAYGDPELMYNKVQQFLQHHGPQITAKHRYDLLDFAKRIQKKDAKHLAASAQKLLEDVVVNWIRYFVDAQQVGKLVLTGGVFANVKLNQRIKEIANVNEIWVFPNMGDGGLSAGSALELDFRISSKLKQKQKSYQLKNVYLGPEYSAREVEKTLKKNGLTYTHHPNIAKALAPLLAQGKVVARFTGGMEYGPRALGNRSIICSATKPDINDWLNKRLKRTEFMPFAPITLYEDRHKCFKNVEGAEHAAQFMTITFDCTDFMKQKSPAAVHIDGTARPQLVKKETNESLHQILSEYKKLTGIPTLINTSFNMHEEPIVCSPHDAVRAFQRGNLDYLAIGNFLVARDAV